MDDVRATQFAAQSPGGDTIVADRPTNHSTAPCAFWRLDAFDVVRFLLGLVLLTAAGLKTHQLLTAATAQSGLFGSRWIVVALIEVELLLGLLLLIGIRRRAIWSASLVFFGFASAVSLSRGLGGESSCECFGTWTVSPWITFTFNLAAVALLATCRPPVRLRRPLKPLFSWPRVVILAVPILLPMLASHATGAVEVLEPESWVGQRLPILDEIVIDGALAAGTWTVVLVHHDCRRCKERIDELADVSGRLAIIQVPPYGEISPGNRALVGRLRSHRQWFVETPTVLSLEDGRVTRVSQ